MAPIQRAEAENNASAFWFWVYTNVASRIEYLEGIAKYFQSLRKDLMGRFI
jgi:hypothetical protein